MLSNPPLKKICGFDAGSVWAVGLDTGGKKSPAVNNGRVEVCYGEQDDGSPAGYTFVKITSFPKDIQVEIPDNNWTWM